MGIKAKQTIKMRVKKADARSGKDYIPCNICHGTGKIKNWHKAKKK